MQEFESDDPGELILRDTIGAGKLTIEVLCDLDVEKNLQILLEAFTPTTCIQLNIEVIDMS